MDHAGESTVTLPPYNANTLMLGRFPVSLDSNSSLWEVIPNVLERSSRRAQALIMGLGFASINLIILYLTSVALTVASPSDWIPPPSVHISLQAGLQSLIGHHEVRGPDVVRLLL